MKPSDKSIIRDFFPSGAIKAEHYEVNGIKEGIEQWWNEQGTLIFKCEFIAGRPHGRIEVWSDSGQRRILAFRKNGVDHGEYTSWWDNGLIKEHGWIIEGVRQPGYKWYHDDGRLWSELPEKPA